MKREDYKQSWSWVEAVNLEEAIRHAFLVGEEKQMVPILKCLPLEQREKYRRIWKEEVEMRKQVRKGGS